MTDKIYVNRAQLSLEDRADAAQELAQAGYEVDEMGAVKGPGGYWPQLAALAWIVRRRTDPAFTLKDAFRLTDDDFVVTDEPPEVSGASTGDAPPSSPDTGT